MRQLRIPAESKEYVHLPFPTAPTNVTTLAVEMAITLYPRSTVEGDWVDAQWTPGASPPAPRVLIGPGSGLALERGTYVLWGRVTAAPELPVVESTYVLTIT